MISSLLGKALRALVDIGRLVEIKSILGESLLISSLPGKVLRTLVDMGRLSSDSICVFKAQPGKLDIKRREPGILFISLPVVALFKLAIMTYFSILVVIQRHERHHSKIATSSWPDKGTCSEIDHVY